MYQLKMKVMAMAALVATSTCRTMHIEGVYPRDADYSDLGANLSPSAEIYYPKSSEFEAATTRWSNLETPTVNVVVVPATENDVVVTVKFANKNSLPFLTYNGVHGAITTLGKMTNGIAIDVNKLNSIQISCDGNTATFGGGVMAKNVTDTLWAAGKQTVTGTCECVSLLGPALGGGHGWLQGHHGLVLDQFVSMNIVLADGSLQTINEQSDLWWAVKGAGHNFGIVTSVTSKIYDIVHSNWAINTMIFTGDKVEAVYQATNEYILQNGTQPADLHSWSYWLNIPSIDPNAPIILLYIIQEGVDVVDSIYTQPFVDIEPVSQTPDSGDYRDLAGWTGIALDSPPCQKDGSINPRFPIYLDTYSVSAQRTAYDLFSSAVSGNSSFSGSIFMFEGYAQEGVKEIDSASAVYAFRGANLLVAPLIQYKPGGSALDQQAQQLGEELRQVLHEASGRTELRTYVNYAYGDETPAQWYGSESWRQSKLLALKQKYDPNGQFSFYAPVA